MAKGLLSCIAEELKSRGSGVLLVENNDRFLYREDVIRGLHILGIDVVAGTQLQQRIQYELRETDTLLVLLSQDNNLYLEDIQRDAGSTEFYLVKCFYGYHIPSIIGLDLEVLDKLFSKEQFVDLNRNDTLRAIEEVTKAESLSSAKVLNLAEFTEELDKLLSPANRNWGVICHLISEGILQTIGTPQFNDLLKQVNRANSFFQEHIASTYQGIKNSSAVKKPQIVSKVLEYLSFNFRNEKIALIVVDGLAFWQYELLKKALPPNKVESVIYSWIPSITQLSRQAIFRGDVPLTDYKQGPASERKLWENYWEEKGLPSFEVRYNHETFELENLEPITKFALVFKDLDEKMHSSTDYNDLLKLTENWIERSKISVVINSLQLAGFKIFLTTDHGNIQAKGWRGLAGREKLGTNKSGSRSERHLEYTEQWLSDEFMNSNPDLKDSVVMETTAIYFKTDLSFSRKDTLVTHGGAHLLEVLIPFIEISNEH